ncbi:hypothetical protein MPL1032_20805 [Mesorhizobium plurifarium]|uniref:Uncharacterized protein n=1 Tax=Mesorhizobium plurifarium TaxID=69974 RepID=A0A0K2VXZ0_MESPL|nr:hypothetical protein MPL1032_20805 [Mesorhizobium plurifarium]
MSWLRPNGSRRRLRVYLSARSDCRAGRADWGSALCGRGCTVAPQAGSVAGLAGNPLTRAIVAQRAGGTARTVRRDLLLALEHLAGAQAPGAGELPEFAQREPPAVSQAPGNALTVPRVP